MGFLQKAVGMFGLGCSPDRSKLEAAASELHEARKDLRTSVSGLGQEVWHMVETGDPLRALVHGARSARFRRDIEAGNEGLND